MGFIVAVSTNYTDNVVILYGYVSTDLHANIIRNQTVNT